MEAQAADGADKAHYMGYSLGGRTGFGVARYAPEPSTPSSSVECTPTSRRASNGRSTVLSKV